MNKPDLKPCPFCGGKANYYSRVDYVAGIRWISAICTGCDVEKDGSYWGTGEHEPANAFETAAFSWNKRAKP